MSEEVKIKNTDTKYFNALTFTEKKLLGVFFGCESDVFLDMKEEDFIRFFRQFNLDINNSKYSLEGDSQIDRFCRCLEIEPKNIVKKILIEAQEYKNLFIYQNNFYYEEEQAMLEKTESLLYRLSGEDLDKQSDFSILPSLHGNQRLMSNLKSDTLTEIAVKAFGASDRKFCENKGIKRTIEETVVDDDLQTLLEMFEKRYVGKDSRGEKSNQTIQKWLSKVNPNPPNQAKKKPKKL